MATDKNKDNIIHVHYSKESERAVKEATSQLKEISARLNLVAKNLAKVIGMGFKPTSKK